MDLMTFGQQILGRRHVDPSVLTTLQQLQVEGTFATGTHLITVDQPISSDEGDLRKALYGSYLPVPSKNDFPPFDDALYEDQNKPGAIVAAQAEPIELNAGRKRVRVKVTNKGDRAVQVSPFASSLTARNSSHSLVADRLALPFHRSQSHARLRPSQSLWLPFRYRGWHFSAL